MKLRIALCDDESMEIEYLSALTRRWAAARGINADVLAFDSAEAFLFFYEEDKEVDILLLDIQMKEIDGITLAKRLREKEGRMQIVFITGLPDFIAEGYEVSALHYLMKPLQPSKLDAVLDRALGLVGKRDESILLDTMEGPVRLLLSDMRHIEAFAHTVMIFTKRGEIEARLSISEIESMLGESFFRCHRSYIVGLGHIRQITKTDVIMDSGKAIPLSRRRYDLMNKAFIRFFRGDA